MHVAVLTRRVLPPVVAATAFALSTFTYGGAAATPTTSVPETSVVLGGGSLTPVFRRDVAPLGDQYVVMVIKPKSNIVDIYATSALSCSGALPAIRTSYAALGLKLGPVLTASLPAETAGYTGSLGVSVTLATDRTTAKMRITGGTLLRTGTGAIRCTAAPVTVQLRLARSQPSAPAKGTPTAGGRYFGAAARDSQKTAFLLNVSADGRSVTNRFAQLFVDCTKGKPYKYIRLDDWAQFPINGGTFDHRETWRTNGGKLGLSPDHGLEINTATSGAFNGGDVAGKVRFDVEVKDATSGDVLDTCTTGDETFEAHT